MNSVPRKLTLGLVLALGAAACGDDVTVREETPVTPTPVVRSVVVSPASATVAPGGSFTFGASVDADAGVARTVTWSASGGTGISVDANGVASTTSSATGVASICATSTVEASVKGCAQLTVTAVVAPSPATVQIDAVTIGCDLVTMSNPAAIVCGLQTPVATTNVYGQIDVQVLLNRPAGSSSVTGVEVAVLNAAGAVEGTTFVQQVTTTAIVAGDELAAQTVSQRMVFSIQTAAYTLNASGAAVVTYTNGNKRIRARLCTNANPTAGSCTSSGTTASQADLQLRFNNVNGFHIAWSNPTGTNSNGVAVRQTSAAGFSWIGGTTFSVMASPVSYDGVTLAAAGVSVNFGGNGCNIGSGADLRTVAATTASNVWTGAFGAYTNATTGNSVSGTVAVTDLDGYEMSPACTSPFVLPLGGEVPFANGPDANGNPFVTTSLFGPFGPFNTLNVNGGPFVPSGTGTFAPAIRLDNQGPNVVGGVVTAPPGPFITFINTAINFRTLAWFNDGVVLNGANTGATSNGTVTLTPTDDGFGGTVVRVAHAGTAAACATMAACLGLPAVTSVAGLAETITNVSAAFVVEAQDPFGNRATPAAVLLIGVDRTQPSFLSVAGASVADFTIMDASAGAFSPSFQDNVSGFGATGTVAVQQSLITVNGSAAGLVRATVPGFGSGTISSTPFAAAASTGASGTLCTEAGTGTFVNTPAAAPFTAGPTAIVVTPVPMIAGPSYGIYQARSRDQAGNCSLMFVRRVYVNAGTIPLITGVSATGTYTGGASVLFPGTGTDATEVISGELRLAYPNIGGDLIYSRPNPTVDVTFDDVMPIPASMPFTAESFIQGLQTVDAAGNPDGDFAGAKPTAVRGRAYNVFGNSIPLLLVASNPAAVTAGVSGISGDFTTPILASQVTTGVAFEAAAGPVQIGNAAGCGAPPVCNGGWLRTDGAGGAAPAIVVSGAASARTTTLFFSVRGITSTFVLPFTSLAVVEAISATTDGRVVGTVSSTAGGTITLAGLTVTITPEFAANTATPAASIPSLDNGVNRDFRWRVVLTRNLTSNPLSPTNARDYMIIGLTSAFNGLGSTIATVTY